MRHGLTLQHARNHIRTGILRLSRSVTTKSRFSIGSLRGKASPTSSLQPSIRNKLGYYNKESGTPEISKKKPLQPHTLSERLKKLCDEGKVDGAVIMLKNAPLDAQNTPVWNTLIWQCMKAHRFKLSYELFIDMKRRGFGATTRTFQTLFKGLSTIEHWPTHPKQLANAHAIYNYFQKHIEAVKRHDPDSEELSIRPLQSYVKILSDAGEYQKMFDMYFTLDQEGPLAPDQHFFTAMFQAIAERSFSPVHGKSASEIGIQNASDAKFVWQDMLKASKRSPGFTVDSHTIHMAIKALSRGRSTDQNFALDIVRNYMGLAQPTETVKPALVPLTTYTLDAVLALCNIMQKYTLCIHFAQQVMYRPMKTDEPSILDRHHLEHVIRAYGSLAAHDSVASAQALQTLRWMLKEELTGRIGPRIRPAASTYNLVLMVCCRCSDWSSALSTFELMTGYHAVDFTDPSHELRRVPRMEKRSKGRNLVPDAETMSAMVRTALVTRDRSNMRQSLRMVVHLGVDDLFGLPVKAGTSKDAKSAGFHQVKLASALTDAVSQILDRQRRRCGTQVSPDEEMAWGHLRSRADMVLERSREHL